MSFDANETKLAAVSSLEESTVEDTGQTIAVAIGVAVIAAVFVCCVIAGVAVVLGFMGPSVGNVFSNIVTTIPTPTAVRVP